ncbi:MAG: aspartate kinase [Elusimicrobia bacterium]|nr:aspartate kinase [Elusimicrobiota bacterium]
MKIQVMKFGGTSVADPEKIQRAADRALTARRRGLAVVVVVSAPGEMTDELLALARRIDSRANGRELDQLMSTGEQVGISLFALACQSKGAAASSLTGAQAGIEVSGKPGDSRIARIRPGRVLKELRKGRIVTVAGFQGINPQGDVATLGRGGSDLTAVALAAALKCARCEIFTDVKGVYTADPRVVSEARKLSSISFEEMLELAGAGAQVMQPRSLELGQRHRVAIHVRSAFHPSPGTWILPRDKGAAEKPRVCALALDRGQARLSVHDMPDRPNSAAQLLSRLSEKGIPVDLIAQSPSPKRGLAELSLTLPKGFASQARQALASACRSLKASLELREHVAKVSVVGNGLRRHPTASARMFETLARHNIDIEMIAASDLRLSCVVDSRCAESAMRALHKAYGLAKA